MNKQLYTTLMLAGLAASLSLGGCAVVGPGERGIKQSFGKVDDHLLQPGLNIYNPLTEGISHRSIQQTTIHSEDKDNSLTRNPMANDQLPVTINYSVLYRIPEGQLLNLYKNYNGDPFDTLIAPKVNEALRQVISEYTSKDVTSKAEEISARVLDLARKNVGALAFIDSIPITHIDLPESIRTAIEQKQEMQVQAQKSQYELQRQTTQAQIVQVNAEAEAKAIQLKSAALKSSPELVKYKLADVELEKAKKWDGALPSTVGGGVQTLFGLK